MWDKLKILWRGRDPQLPAETLPETNAAQSASAGLWRRSRGPAMEDLSEAFRAIDAFIADGAHAEALTAVRALLVAHPSRSDVLGQASRVLEQAGELSLAELFAHAEHAMDAGPHVDLALRFLAMCDPETAVAMARGALERGADPSSGAEELMILALARSGDHGAVLEGLQSYEERGQWPSPGLQQRHALSALLMRDRECYDRISATLGEVPWLSQVAERYDAAPFDATATCALRWLHFVQYGTCLVRNDGILSGGCLDPGQLGGILKGVADACHASGHEVERIAYASRRGEVIARWLASIMGATAQPLSARIPNQMLLVVATDDDDLLDLAAHPSISAGPTLVLQLLKDPRQAEGPVPDMIGTLAHDLSLPLEGLHAARAADRVPAVLMARELSIKAGELTDLPAPELSAWVTERASHLTLTGLVPLSHRQGYVADVPSWVLDHQAISDAPEVQEATSEEQVTVGTTTETAR